MRGLGMIQGMLSLDDAKSELLALLRRKSVFHGEFTLASGAKSRYYIDCRLTTQDAQGAWLVGQLVHGLIRQEQARLGVSVAAVGGLTMGADPVALATAMFSFSVRDAEPLQAFSVRKTPKGHGQGRQIEGNFQAGATVVVVDDVVTRGDSTLAAIQAVQKEGGRVAFVVALVDRQEGGRDRIEAAGYRVIAVCTRDELLDEPVRSAGPGGPVPA